MYLHSRSYL